MTCFESKDYLFITHLGEYTENLISEQEVLDLVEFFPGETFLVNEFPKENEDFESSVFGEEYVPDENLLQTRSGLGEPINVPKEAPETAYFGGFKLTFCMANTVNKVFEEYGQNTDYSILTDYTLDGPETLEDAIEGEEDLDSLTDLERLGYIAENGISQYPEKSRLTSTGI